MSTLVTTYDPNDKPLSVDDVIVVIFIFLICFILFTIFTYESKKA